MPFITGRQFRLLFPDTGEAAVGKISVGYYDVNGETYFSIQIDLRKCSNSRHHIEINFLVVSFKNRIFESGFFINLTKKIFPEHESSKAEVPSKASNYSNFSSFR